MLRIFQVEPTYQIKAGSLLNKKDDSDEIIEKYFLSNKPLQYKLTGVFNFL
jgi:hypothetical protein